MALHFKEQTGSRIFAQSDFGAVYPKNARIAARGATSCGNTRAGKKTEFHEPRGKISGEVDPVDYSSFTLAKIRQSAGSGFG